MDWPTIIAGTTVGGGALVGAGKFLVDLTEKATRIETTLSDHGHRLGLIEKKMPNGEIEETFAMVKEMYQAFQKGTQ
jgi:hypothetical protein